MDPQEPERLETRIGIHRMNEESYLSAEEGGGKWQFLPKSSSQNEKHNQTY